MFMSLLDATIVNVALPSIETQLNASSAVLSWIVSGYALALGLTLIPAGRLGDRYGHKWVYFTGIALFTLASLACGVASSGTSLVVFRVLQGFAGGIFVPGVVATIQILFPPQARGKAFGILGAAIGLSSALGPVIGGLIFQFFGEENGWRLVFLVNIPVGIITLVAAWKLLPADRAQRADTKKFGIDPVGILLVSAGFVALLVPLIQGESQGWPAWTFATLALGVALLVAFGFWETAYTNRGLEPLVPPSLFRYKAFSGGVTLSLVYFAAFTSIFFTITILWQSGLGHSPLQSGLVALPFAFGTIITSSQSSKIVPRLGRNILVIGATLVAIGLFWTWLVLRNTAPLELTNWMLLAPLFIAGIGNGLFIAPNLSFIVATVESSYAGTASAVISALQRVGSAVGIAVIGSVLFGTLEINGNSRLAVATGFTNAAAAAMLVSALFCVAALMLVFLLPRRAERAGARRG
ncbi:DHA2 family efflux MFS transporter permease subunit [Nakamurella antarctica]|uniref:DHA2 family efflux MFS transporter permease subunit n=2 Tax=Nakamurella antarctica TaxID=1902245 RepID=A0A3G8ZRS3_9ACTN|nr:DHA2 family efflux MFS transporter permease subunit [Nakamurella antarctica]